MKIKNKYNLPQPFVDAATNEHVNVPKRYSTTNILKGTCEAILLRRHDDEIEQDVSDMVWLIFGSAVHKILAGANETPNQIKENWASMQMPNGYTLSGVFDLYDGDIETVIDYKTVSVYKELSGDWEDYRRQLLCYCVLLRAMDFPAHHGQIVAMLKDWSTTKTREPGYPPHNVVVHGWDFTDDDLDAAETAIENKFWDIEKQEQLPDEQLRPCSPAERWHKQDTWAVYRGKNKNATKVFSAEAPAKSFISMREKPKEYRIEFRPGYDRKCQEYCLVKKWCPYWKNLGAQDEQ